MRRNGWLSTILIAALVGMASPVDTTAAPPAIRGAKPSAGGSSTPDYMTGHGPMTAQQRGHYARDFVNKWAVYYQATYQQSISGWAQKQARIIGTADPENLRNAMRKTTLEAAMMTIRGHQVSDEDAIDFLARRPESMRQEPLSLAGLANDLVYTPLVPCRIFDTRLMVGPIGSGASRVFDTYPHVHAMGFDYQGGVANSDCGIERSSAAVAINIAAPLPESDGFLTVYPWGTSRPLASSLDYSAGEFKNNEIAVLRGEGGVDGFDITIYAHGRTHVVGDVVGYYAAPKARKLDCFTMQNSWTFDPGEWGMNWMDCPDGYSQVGGVAHWDRVSDQGPIKLTSTSGSAREKVTSVATNTSASEQQQMTMQITCCRVPGR